MSDESEPAPIIDLIEARQQRLHKIHEGRLAKVRAAFEKAMPLPSRSAKSSTKKSRRKKPPKR